MHIIHSISEYHRLTSLPAPAHPLISLVDVSKIRFAERVIWEKFSMTFYCISLKKNINGNPKYGREFYDHDKGIMSFVAPMQLLSLDTVSPDADQLATGYALFIHPDFFVGHPLAAMSGNYAFFSYAVNEALHLSQTEEENIVALFEKIEQEYKNRDEHTDHIIQTQIDLILTYSNRFYKRQFATRKKVNHDIIDRLDGYLTEHFNAGEGLRKGVPSVEALAGNLNVSPHYLSDLLRSVNGLNTQQYIQIRLLEKAKEYLSTTELSVAEIAYLLGFEYPQSFNKLFKKKMNISPLEFRKSMPVQEIKHKI